MSAYFEEQTWESMWEKLRGKIRFRCDITQVPSWENSSSTSWHVHSKAITTLEMRGKSDSHKQKRFPEPRRVRYRRMNLIQRKIRVRCEALCDLREFYKQIRSCSQDEWIFNKEKYDLDVKPFCSLSVLELYKYMQFPGFTRERNDDTPWQIKVWFRCEAFIGIQVRV